MKGVVGTMPMLIYDGGAFSFPFLDGGGPSVRSGELKVAEGPGPEAKRLGSFLCVSPPGTVRAEKACGCCIGVGLPGADVLGRGGGGGIGA
jgi:hypothetical protein